MRASKHGLSIGLDASEKHDARVRRARKAKREALAGEQAERIQAASAVQAPQPGFLRRILGR